MKITTLYDLIKMELHERGFDELVNDGKFTFYNNEYAFMKKISRFDEDVQSIVNDLFQGERLIDDEADRHFKRLFVTKFIDRTIKTQTMDMFSNRIVQTFLLNDEFINHIYDINSFLTGVTTSENKDITESHSTGKNNAENVNRSARTELPQTQVNVNVDSTELEYANEFNLSKNQDNSNNENESNSTSERNSVNRSYSMDNLIKIKGLLESVFVDFDRNCFTQIF